MKVVITGANGQVGWELTRSAPDDINLVVLQRAELDITDTEEVTQLLKREKPDWVINAAAYTAVDKAEEEIEQAYRINRDGPENVAMACKQVGARMLQISTDFVFDGRQATPYEIDSTPNPLCVYGASKQAGEMAVLKELGDSAIVLRTSWIYSAHGNNFVKTMLRLMSERDELSVVADQVGAPTWAYELAVAIWKMVKEGISGYQHWSDYGVASWYDFAIAIYEEATYAGLLDKKCKIKPIRSEQYKMLAVRPHYSVLDKSDTVSLIKFEPQHWRQTLRRMLAELKKYMEPQNEID